MQIGKLIAATAAALCFAGSAAAEFKPEISVDGWVGGPYFHDDQGFIMCMVTAEYRNGVALVSSADLNYEWRLGLINDSWRLTEGTEFDVDVQIDRRTWRNVSGSVIDTDMVQIYPMYEEGLLEAFRLGSVMTIRANSAEFGFELGGTNAHMKELAACVERHGGSGSVADPFGGTVTNPADPFGGSVSRQEWGSPRGRAVLAEVIQVMGPGEGRFIDPESDTGGLFGVPDALWENENIAFGYSHDGDVGANAAAAIAIAIQGEICAEGDFRSATNRIQKGAVQAVTMCSIEGIVLHVENYAVPEQGGGMSLVSIAQVHDSGADIVPNDAKIGAAVVQAVSSTR